MHNNTITIRAEKIKDFKKIDEILRSAFGDFGIHVIEEVHLIRKSRNYIPELALVAEINGEIVGYCMLSHVQLKDNQTFHQVMTLSPLAVLQKFQRQGIGAKLIQTSIEKSNQLDEPLIVLEGSPEYYPRFGFKYAKIYNVNIDLPHWAPKEAAMIYPLINYESDIKGQLIYPPAFDKVNEIAHNQTSKSS